jgi:predicted mannosyl-3-phosphoglycerate phosphatase (HAD superfamily)
MEKRAFERIPADIKVRFYCNNTEFSGTIVNLSENGMFINTEESWFPFDVQFDIPVSLEEEILNISVNLNRIILSPDSNGIGVELISPSEKYLKFVSRRKASLKA